jgi:hypothetical protein
MSNLAVRFCLATVFSVLAGGVAAQQTPATEQPATESVIKKVDPTDFRNRFELRSELQESQNQGRRWFNVPRIDYAFSKVLAARIELPLLVSDPNQPGQERRSGNGNLLLRGMVRAVRGPDYAVVAAGELILDTASHPSLGFNRTVISPNIFGSLELPSLNSVMFLGTQYYRSIESGPPGTEVKFGQVRGVLLTRLPDRFYVASDLTVYHDSQAGGRNGSIFEFELGRILNPKVGLWLRPGFGLTGDNLPQVYNWSVEVGMRYFF